MRHKIIEIGFGPHAKRVYGPALEKLGEKFNTGLQLVIDLEDKKKDIVNFFSKYSKKPDFLFIKSFTGDSLPEYLSSYLSNYVKKKNINGVIISTEPLSHYSYAKWALDEQLDILMDKPITSVNNVVSNMKNANKIETDYRNLLTKYINLQKNKKTIFIINTQRRFHPGFNMVKQLLTEISLETNCPVTSISSYHCDGQWRLPNEIITQNYHPYNSGYGKGSHSGYHFFDIVSQFYKISKITNKIADEMEIYSSFFQPRGFLHQLNQNDYEKYFGSEYQNVNKYSDSDLYKMYDNYGEIDLSTIIRLKKEGECIGNITINLLHNGFAMRNWVKPDADLYKGNGRVKHEYHNIQQGPFQNIQIHSYQSKDKHDINTLEDYELGGNNHFDIYVFRNKNLVKNGKSLDVIHMSDYKNYDSRNNNHELVAEQVKHKVVAEFLGFIENKVKKEMISSNIDDHLMPVQIMSGVYKSHNKYIRRHNPLVSYKLSI